MGMGSAAAPSSAHCLIGPWVVCLALHGGGACREYRGAVLEELAGDWPQVRFEWVTEDEEDVVGEVDVERPSHDPDRGWPARRFPAGTAAGAGAGPHVAGHMWATPARRPPMQAQALFRRIAASR